MNHFKISLIKSALRLLGSAGTCISMIFYNYWLAIVILAVSYGFAEMLGVLEELFDKRKEN